MNPGELVAQRFAIEELAGTGGMGAVYRARDLNTGQRVALKVLLGTPCQEDELRFEREAQALTDIDHPGIVRAIAHGFVSPGRPYLAMEWVEGHDLATRLAQGPLSVAETMALGKRVAEALGAAHARGVVHRDLKPQNLLLEGDDPERVKIVDFGIAMLPEAPRATLSGAVIGTPAYMAPEQAHSSRDVDARADVFALGCVLHECITGRPAFAGHHVMAVLAKIVFEEVPLLRRLHLEVPPALDLLIARMLAKDPGSRPADGRAVASALAAMDCVTLRSSAKGPASRPIDSSVIEGVPSTASSSARSSTGLTRGEQRLLCIVLAKAPPGVTDPVAATETRSSFDAPHAALDAVRARGGRPVVLVDGTLAVTAPREGPATDQAATAAACAIALHEALPRWAIAVAAGRAELGAERAVGDAIERAARRVRARQHASETSSIDIDDTTAGLLDLRFEVRVGALGIELAGERAVAEAARTLLGQPTTFVGRDRELATLEALFAECVDEPAARAVLITAPAGVGKSRLRYELTERLRRNNGDEPWLARGDAMRTGVAFGLLGQLMRHIARLLAGESQEVGRRKLLARVSRHVAAPERLRVAEFLGEISGVSFPDEGRMQLHAARQNPQLLGDQIRRAWADFVGAEVRADTLVIVLEDLHWGDAPSAECLDAALRLSRDQPLFVLGFARPEVHERLPGLWGERAVQEIRLTTLSRRASERLIRDVLGERATPEIVALLWERSAGNAFFLEELLRATAEGHGGEMPETMLAMVESRLDALNADDRRILRAGSVLGEVFWGGALNLLLGAEDTSSAALARLEAKEWIVTRPAPKFHGETEYAFRHAIVREAVYHTLTEEDRTLGHHLAATWLESAGETDPDVLAEHYERGGQPDNAVRWYCLAAEQALEGNDLAGVAARVDRAVSLGATGEEFGRLALVQAIAHNWRGSHQEAEVWAGHAVATLPEGSARWCAAMCEQMWTAADRGDSGCILTIGHRLIASPAKAMVPAALATALAYVQAWLSLCAPQIKLDTLRAALDELLVSLPAEPSVAATAYLAQRNRAAIEGDVFSSRELTARAIASFEDAGNHRQACLQRGNLAELCIRLGAYDEAATIARWTLAEANGWQLPLAAREAKGRLGLALLHSGLLAEARSALLAAIADYATSNDGLNHGTIHAYFAEALRRSGDLVAAEAEARRAVSLLGRFEAQLPLAQATLADVLLAQGRASEALDVARPAYATLQSAGSIDEGDALVRLVFALALDATGDQATACDIARVARDRLLGIGERIPDERYRKSFLNEVPENARTFALAGRLLADG